MFSLKERKERQQSKCQTTGNNYVNYSPPIQGPIAVTLYNLESFMGTWENSYTSKWKNRKIENGPALSSTPLLTTHKSAQESDVNTPVNKRWLVEKYLGHSWQTKGQDSQYIKSSSQFNRKKANQWKDEQKRHRKQTHRKEHTYHQEIGCRDAHFLTEREMQVKVRFFFNPSN